MFRRIQEDRHFRLTQRRNRRQGRQVSDSSAKTPTMNLCHSVASSLLKFEILQERWKQDYGIIEIIRLSPLKSLYFNFMSKTVCFMYSCLLHMTNQLTRHPKITITIYRTHPKFVQKRGKTTSSIK